ncbi:HD-GYP domain-containing protein [Clostridium rectalis]|uniref:HD-GYP domain-containing protein n=1 Tax=Clostridium rectalis TaxID=2040295 RepID=UPI000F62C442|nr:HD-GYP domain-containing protein [Clostridium rectalis]
MEISMDKIIRAMSIALDLAEMSSMEGKNIVENITNINYSKHKFMHHSERTAYISLELANYMKLSTEIKKSLYISSLLHDIGAANFLTLSHSSSKFISEHCRLGFEITKDLPYFSNISKIILNHHENINGSGPNEKSFDDIPIESQIIRLSDIVELLYNENIPCYKQKSKIINWVKDHTHIIFSNDLVQVFLNCSKKDSFWFNIENINLMDLILDSISPKLNIFLNLNEFEEISNIFAKIIDTKSRFTAMHSKNISQLAYRVSKFINYNEEKCKKMRISGLLHDIGKLAIPSNILDKNGSLSEEEYSLIKSHVYYTKIILDRIGDINDISNWASNHHEKLNGTGYPHGLQGSDLSEECRIMAVCDIYQALTEDRPYRDGLNKQEAFSILRDMVNKNLICGKCVNYLEKAIKSN